MRVLAAATSRLDGGAMLRTACRSSPAPPAWLAAALRRPRACPAGWPVAGRASRHSTASSSSGWLLSGASPWDSLACTATSSQADAASSSGSSSNPGYDAIMMLGGGLLPDGGLPEWVVRRLEGCLFLYQQQLAAQQQSSTPVSALSGNGNGTPAPQQQQQQQLWAARRPGSCPIVLLGAGTPHKPPVIDAGGYVLHESTAYADYLMQRGVPAGDLLKEAQSYDTVGNGYFSLCMHALPAGWRRIAVVTSEFHMPRTQATFDFVYQLAGRQLYSDASWFQLDYRPVSDEGIFDPEVIAARAEKEAAAVATWRRNTAGMQTIADLHAWLYATHLCYSVSRQHEFGRVQELDPKLAASY